MIAFSSLCGLQEHHLWHSGGWFGPRGSQMPGVAGREQSENKPEAAGSGTSEANSPNYLETRLFKFNQVRKSCI